jgi:hypothetical protein
LSETERKKKLVGMETQFRRAATALAVAQADFEKAYTDMHAYMNEHTDGPHRVLAFTPGVTLH